MDTVNGEIDQLFDYAFRSDRLYPIKSNKGYGFFTGRLADGRQALVTCGIQKKLCAYLFSTEGDYLGVERREPKLIAEPEELGAATNDRELHDYLAKEFGFTPDLIRVKEFDEPAELVSINPLPRYLDESELDDESYLVDLRQWVEDGAFVLITWNDYWLNANGEVTAS